MMIRRHNLSLFIIFFVMGVFNPFHINSCCADAGSTQYQGSQAYNQPKLFKESVNAATGTFDFSYPLINAIGKVSPFTFDLTYRLNNPALFGLPKGWRFSLDYVDGKILHLGSQQWIIDPLWHDETGFGSGLRYFNLHGARFEDKGFPQEIPEKKGLFYRYRLTHKDGSIKYFSHEGWLVLSIDRFKNSILFEYKPAAHSLTEARLIKITDNYDNVYRLSYEPNAISLHYPDGRLTQIYFNEKGVISIINPLKQRVAIDYIQLEGFNLIRQVESREGLVIKLSYGDINYISATETKNAKVVNRLEKYDRSTNKTLEETFYQHSTGNNFTGYPKYSMTSTGDSLMDSNDQSYRYAVKVSRNNLQEPHPLYHTKIFYYNYLHLPVEIVTFNQGDIYSKTTYEYDISPFKYSRSTNYDKPVNVTHWIWDADNDSYLPSDRKKSRYDTFGNKREDHLFIFNREQQTWLPVLSLLKHYDTYYFSLLTESVQVDHFSQRQIRHRYRLTQDHKVYCSKQTEYRDKKNAWSPWQKSSMKHDAYGRQTQESIEWAVGGNPGLQKTCVETTYTFDKKSAQLTTKKHSALGTIKTAVVDTRNGNQVQTITPCGEVTNFDYDAMGRMLTMTDTIGVVMHKQYTDFQHHGLNSTQIKSPLGDKKRSLYDALGRVTVHQDAHDSAWRTLSSDTFNGWGKVTKKTNILGLSLLFDYDEQQRMVSASDPWGNIRTHAYDDMKMITTSFVNQHKISEVQITPWLLKTTNRTFPVLDNPRDKTTHFIEHATYKDGVGNIVKNNSFLVDQLSLVKSKDIQSTFIYDVNQNRIESFIKGYDGISYHRFSCFDLLNNKIRFKKTLESGGKAYTHSGYAYGYNEDNLLVSEETPKDSVGRLHKTFYHYDKNGRLIKKILPNGHEIKYHYDARGQLTETSWQREGEQYIQLQHYDADGRILQVSDNEGQSVTHTYTKNGLLLTTTHPDGRELSYVYDATDRIVEQTDVTGFSQSFTYKADDKGELSSIVQQNNAINFTYGLDDNGYKGCLLQKTMDSVDEGHTHTHNYYDAMGFLSKVSTKNNKAGVRYEANYRYLLRGELGEQSTEAQQGQALHKSTTRYQYDSIKRLTQETLQQAGTITDTHYDYDGNDNLLHQTVKSASSQATVGYACNTDNYNIDIDYTYNGLDQLTAISNGSQQPTKLVYDCNGRLIRDVKGTVYQYDDRDFLLSAMPSGGNPIRYQYLPTGLLSGKSFKEDMTHFYYDKKGQAITLDHNGQWINLLRKSGTIIASHHDQLFDQWYMQNLSTGAFLKNGQLITQGYEGYGNRVSEKPPSLIESFGWHQAYTDDQAHLTYLHSRFYSPQLKRFITKDTYPVENRYAYGLANPISNIDPTGHTTQQAINYTIGASSTVFGVYAMYESVAMAIVGAILAVPTGGASLSLSAGSAVVASVAATASGIALLGSQGAFDTGNQAAAEALNYTSLAFSAIHVVSGLIAIAPKIENLITRIAERVSQGRSAATFAPEADASTAYHLASEFYEGEKDLSKIISQWGAIRHGIHAASKITADGFNMKHYLKNNPVDDVYAPNSQRSPASNAFEGGRVSLAPLGLPSQVSVTESNVSSSGLFHRGNGNTVKEIQNWQKINKAAQRFSLNHSLSVVDHPVGGNRYHSSFSTRERVY